jgi:glycosyltransferase involved in cell wall biosynthesis
MRPEISYVVLTLNSSKTLAKCLDAIQSQSISKEILVVDSGSTDNTLAIANECGIRVIKEHDRNIAESRNLGVLNSTGRYIAFVDSDCVLCKDWDKRLVAHIKGDVVGACGIPISAERTWVTDQLDKNVLLGMDRTLMVESIATMNALYDAKIFRGNILFDARMNRVGEDLELNLHLKEMGYCLVQDGTVIVRHYHPTTLRKLCRRHFEYGKGYAATFMMHTDIVSPSFYFAYVWDILLLLFGLLSIINPIYLIMFVLVLASPFINYMLKKPYDIPYWFVNGLKLMSKFAGMIYSEWFIRKR